jgi:hypothetical protein
MVRRLGKRQPFGGMFKTWYKDCCLGRGGVLEAVGTNAIPLEDGFFLAPSTSTRVLLRHDDLLVLEKVLGRMSMSQTPTLTYLMLIFSFPDSFFSCSRKSQITRMAGMDTCFGCRKAGNSGLFFLVSYQTSGKVLSLSLKNTYWPDRTEPENLINLNSPQILAF